MDEDNPELAKQCWNVAKEFVIAAKRYDLARKYIGNPVREFTKIKAMYDQNTTLYDDLQVGGTDLVFIAQVRYNNAVERGKE